MVRKRLYDQVCIKAVLQQPLLCQPPSQALTYLQSRSIRLLLTQPLSAMGSRTLQGKVNGILHLLSIWFWLVAFY